MCNTFQAQPDFTDNEVEENNDTFIRVYKNDNEESIENEILRFKQLLRTE